jgi:hypothetical protein
MGILGIYASSVLKLTNSYESIATLAGTGSSGTISFTSIPSTYKHLQIRFMAKASGTGGVENPWLRFNNDSATNYSAHRLVGDGASASADAFTTVAQVRAGFIPDSTTASLMGVAIIDILDYADTNKYKTIRLLSGVDQNGSGYVTLSSGNWRSTSAVNRIDLIENGLNWTSNSTFALYGIKG